MGFVILAIPFIVVIAACVVVTRAKPWLRIVALLFSVGLFSHFAYTMGAGVERGRFLSSHLHWFAKYSAYLDNMVEQGQDDKLKVTIKEFDRRFQADPASSTNIQDIMYRILQVGPYYQNTTNGMNTKPTH